MKYIICKVEKVIFRDEKTGRTIMSVILYDGKKTRLLGKISKADKGYVLKATGSWSKDEKYGWQFNSDFIQTISKDAQTDESVYLECLVKEVRVIKVESGFASVKAENTDGSLLKMSGSLAKVRQGVTIGVLGKWKHDERYGDEFKVSFWEYKSNGTATALSKAYGLLKSMQLSKVIDDNEEYENENAVDMFNLGVQYYEGEDVEQDYSQAAQWFLKSAELGLVEAQAKIGLCYYYGIGVQQDQSKAAEWWSKASEQGYAEAHFNLATCYSNGQGVDKNDSEALRLFRKAADQGLANAQYVLGLAYARGLGVAKDEDEATKWFVKAAEQGSADAMRMLESTDFGMTELDMLQVHAVSGNPEAQFLVGVAYYYENTGEEGKEEAFKFFLLSAQQGHMKAQYNLGVCYGQGEGIERNYSEAVRWYLKAAEQGFAEAQYNLALCYYKGQGIQKPDFSEAVKWFEKAAKQDLPQAQCCLGLCYYRGEGGLQQDFSEAVKWFEKAATQNLPEAQYSLVLCYKFGNGVMQDKSEATKWLFKAAEQGYDAAQSFICTSLLVIR